MIRLMQTADIPAAMRLKDSAGWNQTEQDWANVLALEPEGCWVYERDGRVAGTTTAICYGQELAWIGMALVLPEFRGQGLARALMEHCLRWLESRQIRQVKLDATDMGLPLYEKLDFRPERTIERWGVEWDRPPCLSRLSAPAGPIAAFDGDCFGVDRTRLIERFCEAFPNQGVWEEGRGYILGRPGSNAYFLGPCAATDAETAHRLIRTLKEATRASRFFWDLFPDQPAAVELARALDFERKRSLVRMALKPEASPLGRPERIFGAAGFEYG